MLRISSLIHALEGTQPAPYLVVDEQTAGDIVDEVCKAHRDHAAHYDRIAGFVDSTETGDICYELWDFCKSNLIYKEETGEHQNVSCPYTILTRRVNDCKNYSSFIAGMLDALRRKGYPLTWKYRFVSYGLFDSDPHHVFVVCNPNTEDYWIDPVLNDFNYRTFYWHKKERRPRVPMLAGIGSVSYTIGSTAAENTLLADVKSYADGLANAIAQTHQSGMFNSISESVLQTAAVAFIPGGAAALAALKAGAVFFDNAFGVGAVSSRLITDLSNLNIVGLFNDVFNGRTYNTDQYWAAVYYKFYVLGQNITDINRIADSDVLPALKWFIDRSGGVFISGREHIIALTQSPQAYMNYYGVNHDTTTNATAVQAAYMVASKYWRQPGNFDQSLLGAWAGTIGVFDNGLVQLANQANLSAEQVNLQISKQTGQTDFAAQQFLQQNAPQAATTIGPLGPDLIPGIDNTFLFVAAGGVILYGLIASK